MNHYPPPMKNPPKSWRDLYIGSLTIEQLEMLKPSIWEYFINERINELKNGKKEDNTR